MVDLSRRDVLKIGGGIAVFTGATGGALTILQSSAAGEVTVDMDIELSESAQDGVDTPDGRLEVLQLDLTRYDITYSNLSIADSEEASMEVTIDFDIRETGENDMITQNLHTETFDIEEPGDNTIIDVLRDGERIDPFDLLEIVEDEEDDFFSIPDGESKQYTLTVSTNVQLEGIDLSDLDEENTVLDEVANLDLEIHNQEGEVETEITGVIDAE